MSNNENPLVSICVVTFNQQLYISDAINSFLKQKFDGRLEIVIGEDCSTDNTRELLEKFQQEFPDKIRLITSDQNVGAQRNFTRVLKAAKGDYIAICDGDDYWLDEFKIKKQLEALTRTGCNLCFTKAQKIQAGIAIGEASEYGDTEKIFSSSQIIRGGGGFIPSPTIFVSKSIVTNLPDWYETAPVGDYYLQILSCNNGAVYLPDVTAAYRVQAEGSWSKNNRNKSQSLLLNELSKHVTILKTLNFDQSDINFAIANEYTQTAKLLLVNKYHLNFKECIENSWQLSPFSTRFQTFLYYLRRFPKLIDLYFKYK